MNFIDNSKFRSEILEGSEITSWSNMYDNAEKKCELFKIKTGTCFSIPNYESLTYNRVMVDEPDLLSSKDFSVFDEFYRRIKINRYMMSFGPMIENRMTDQFLSNCGYKLHNCWIKLYLDLSSISYQSTEHSNIRPLLPMHKEEYIQLICEVFDWPPLIGEVHGNLIGKSGFHHYGIFENQKLVASGCLYVDKIFSSLFLGLTHPDHRGKGFQKNLIKFRLNLAKMLDSKIVVTETGNDTEEKPNYSFRNLLKAGFSIGYRRNNYLKELN